MASFLGEVTADVIRAQVGDTYDRFDAGEQAQHVALLQSLRRPQDVAFNVEETGDKCWTVTVCAADCVGALSIIAGLFTAYRLDILSAEIFTLRLPAHRTGQTGPQDRYPIHLSPVELAVPRRALLDVFHTRALADLPPDSWRSFKEELAALVSLLVAGQRRSAQESIIDRVSEAFRTMSSAGTKLLPMSIDLANEPSSPQTRLTVRSADTPGFLFAFTNALAGLSIIVERAEVRSVDDEACDTLWVTDVGGGQIADHDRIHELRVATTLVKQFTHLLPRSANPGQALRQFNALIAQMLSRPRWAEELVDLDSLPVLETLAEVMGVSRFLWEDLLRMQHENLFHVLVDVPALDESSTREQLREDLRQRLRGREGEAARIDELNAFKDREMFRIDLRHITGRSQFLSFARELSDLAEVTVEAAADLTWKSLCQQFGLPIVSEGRVCPWCVCALGKFGGRELGFGSDLELIFVYEAEGTAGGQPSVLNSEFFGRFVQAFKGAIRARQEGIFDVDLRLRPFGSGGALAVALDGFARYYSKRGAAEQFERMALVRLRPLCGDAALGAGVLQRRDAFVYSHEPLDIDNILHLRHRQAKELVPSGRVSAKYSSGGVVDIEYFVQARQIVAGCGDPGVRVASTLDAVRKLAEGGHIQSELAESLQGSYVFLRRLIDALRVVRGHAKDLTIPSSQAREFAYLAHRLRCSSPEELEEAIGAHMAFARGLWANYIPPCRYAT